MKDVVKLKILRLCCLTFRRGVKRGFSEVDDEEEEENHDEVRLYEEGFKDRYYESKFEVTAENLEFRRRVADEYARGLCWVLKYVFFCCFVIVVFNVLFNPFSATRRHKRNQNKIKVKGLGRNISYLASFLTYFHGYRKFTSQLNTSGREPTTCDTPVSHSIDIPT